jgi:serine phosphatase RsbU (regulator of sigma subunit)
VGAALALAPSTAADEFPEEDPIVLSGTLDERVQIINGWRYHPGDDLAWAAPTFDDAGWPVVSSLLLKDDDPPGGWPGIGWFRRRLELAGDMPTTAVGIRVVQPGASEVYLDGRLVVRNGIVSSDAARERPFYANDFSGMALEPGCAHVLAVRYSNVRENNFDNGMRGFGLNLRSVQSAANAYHRWDIAKTVVPSFFVGAFASLALLHMLLFAFHRGSREHLYFAIFATALAVTFALEIGSALETDLQARLGIFKLTVAASAAAVLAGLSLVNAVFRRRRQGTTWLIALAAVLLVGWVASWTAYGSMFPARLFLLVGYLEMFRVSVAAVMRRERDAWVVAVAFVPLAAGGAAETLSQLLMRPFAIGVLVHQMSFILVAIAFSVFISRRAARTSRELELRLDEVEELSARALEQERRALREEAERHVLEAEREQRQVELEAARRLQLAMLPQSVPSIGGIDVAFRMVTATEVGGDYVDVRPNGNGQALLAVGDATSHGLQAGMVVSVAKSLFQGVNPDETPADVLHRIGQGLQSLSERHASMAMVVIAVSDDHLEVASAGMPPILVRRGTSGSVEEVLLPGVPLGTLPNPTYPVHKIPFASGDTVLVISDGVVETLDSDHEPFGYERVAAHLARTAGATAEEVVAEVLDAVIDFAGDVPLQDDVTVLGMVVT